MNVETLLVSLTEGLNANIHVNYALCDNPDKQIESEFLDKNFEKFLQAEVVNFNLETNKNYDYFMLTVFIKL